MASRLLEKYKAEIKPVLEAEFPKNKTLTAKIDKVVISVGAGEAMKDTKLIQNMQDTISLIAGHQGEKNASLMRIANGEHRIVKLTKGDTVVFASSVIPGNERTVQRLKDTLFRK